VRGSDVTDVVSRGSAGAVARVVGHAGGLRFDAAIEVPAAGARRVLVNGKARRSVPEIASRLAATWFGPDDLALVKAGPEVRRRFLDQMVSERSLEGADVVERFDRTLRHRNALLRAAGAHVDTAVLDVWDARLAEAGAALAFWRRAAAAELAQPAANRVAALFGMAGNVTTNYTAPWWTEEDACIALQRALRESRPADLERRVSTVGPHRDDLEVRYCGRPARVQTSQGEQRALALALALARHEVLAAVLPDAPLLLLDDVLSELDDHRREALLASLPRGQAFLTSAAPVPGAGMGFVVKDGEVLAG
jgi:DNA replication and repair protein RecF